MIIHLYGCIWSSSCLSYPSVVPKSYCPLRSYYYYPLIHHQHSVSYDCKQHYPLFRPISYISVPKTLEPTIDVLVY